MRARRDEHKPAGGAALGLAEPRVGGILEGDHLVRDLEPAVGGVLGDRGHRGRLLLAGELVVGVAEHPQRAAADRRGVERCVLGGGAAEVDQPTAGSQALGRGRGGYAVQRVEHEVHRSVDRGAQPRRPARRRPRCRGRRPRRHRRPGPAAAPRASGPRPRPARRRTAWPAGPRPARPRRRRRARRRSRPAPARRARSAPCRPRWRTVRVPRSRSARLPRAAAPGRQTATAASLGHAAVARRHPCGHREPHRPAVDRPDTLHAGDVRRPRARRSTTCRRRRAGRAA